MNVLCILHIVELLILSGKTTFIHYVANLFAKKYTFADRLALKTIELNMKQTYSNSHCSEEKYVVDQYSFPIDDQTVLVFLELLDYDTDGDEIRNLFGITQFAGAIKIMDGTDIEDGVHENNCKLEDLSDASDEFREVSDICRHFWIIYVNCSARSRSMSDGNISSYFMQNSAYQLYKSRSLADSVEADYYRSMQTIKQIIQKILDEVE